LPALRRRRAPRWSPGPRHALGRARRLRRSGSGAAGNGSAFAGDGHGITAATALWLNSLRSPRELCSPSCGWFNHGREDRAMRTVKVHWTKTNRRADWSSTGKLRWVKAAPWKTRKPKPAALATAWLRGVERPLLDQLPPTDPLRMQLVASDP